MKPIKETIGDCVINPRGVFTALLRRRCQVGQSPILSWPLTDPQVVSGTRYLVPRLWALGSTCKYAQLPRKGDACLSSIRWCG